MRKVDGLNGGLVLDGSTGLRFDSRLLGRQRPFGDHFAGGLHVGEFGLLREAVRLVEARLNGGLSVDGLDGLIDRAALAELAGACRVDPVGSGGLFAGLVLGDGLADLLAVSPLRATSVSGVWASTSAA